MRSDTFLTEYVQVMMKEGKETNREDSLVIFHPANRTAGGCILDAMDRAETKRIMTGTAWPINQAMPETQW